MPSCVSAIGERLETRHSAATGALLGKPAVATGVGHSQFHVEYVTNGDGKWQIWLGARRDLPNTADLLLVYAPDPGRMESMELALRIA